MPLLLVVRAWDMEFVFPLLQFAALASTEVAIIHHHYACMVLYQLLLLLSHRHTGVFIPLSLLRCLPKYNSPFLNSSYMHVNDITDRRRTGRRFTIDVPIEI